MYPPYPITHGTIGAIGLGVSINADVNRPENAWLRDRFAKYGAGDARSRFAWLILAYRAANLAGHYLDTVPIESIMLEPNGVNVRPEDPFWNSSENRKKIHDRLLKQVPGVPITVTTRFDLGAIGKIPILGPVLKAATSPLSIAVNLAQGERFDHAMLDAAKDQLGAIKAIGPYVATVISFVPGIGTGVAAAIAAGVALASGKTIDQALEDAIKSAIPGGALAVTGFELAKKVATGQNVGKAVLEAARSQLPPVAQKAFDIGLAVVNGKQLQSAITSAIVNLAPAELKQVLDVGAKAVQSVPGLSELAKSLPTDIARQGLQLASGVLAHAGVNEAQVRAMRSKLTGDVLKGFDTALKSQAAHYPWVDSVVAQAPVPIPQTQLDLQKLAQLSPAEQKQLVDMQALSKLSPAEQKQLADYAAAQNEPKATPKPGEPPKKPAATPKPGEPPAKKTPTAAPTVVTRAVAPAAASAAPAPGGPHYGPYPNGIPSGALHGAYPGGLSAPPHLPHPAHHGGHRGGGGGPWWHGGPQGSGPWWGVPFVPDASTSTSEICRVWGSPIVLPPAMERAARAALGASRGNPTTVRGPDGVLYLFAFENGQLAARACAAVAIGT